MYVSNYLLIRYIFYHNKYQTLSFQYVNYKIHFDYKVKWKRLQIHYYELDEADKQTKKIFGKDNGTTPVAIQGAQPYEAFEQIITAIE